MKEKKKRDSRWMRWLVMALAVTVTVGFAQAQTPVDEVTYESDDEGALIATITVGGFTVDASELVNGTSNISEVDDLVPDSGNFGNAGGGMTTLFDDVVNFPNGGLVDTNGAGNPDIFVFESNGQDDLEGVWATYSDGGPQLEGTPITADGGVAPGGDWGFAGDGRGIDDQDGAAMAFNISDLLDAGGLPLSATAVIHALHITDDGHVDLTVIAVHVIPCPIVTTHSGGNSLVAEAGSTSDSFTVELRQAPTAEVTLTLDPRTDDVSLNAEAPNDAIILTFTTANWNVPQTVTVTANDDAEVEANPESVPIDIVSASDDPDFACEIGTAVLVVDNESPFVSIEQTDGVTDPLEGGAADTYNISLALGRAPTNNVLITIDPRDDPNQVTVNGGAPGELETLTFTPANWQTPQAVTVAAIDDAEAEAHPHLTMLTHTASSGDAGYDGIALGNLLVVVGENDCGAGPFAATDVAGGPEGGPDCKVDLQDFAVTAARMLDCSIQVCN